MKKAVIFAGAMIFILLVGILFLLVSNKSPKADSLAIQCKFACDSGQKISFCDVERTLLDKTKTTCNDLAKQTKLGVETCPEISCVKETLDTSCVSGLGSVWKIPTSEGNCPAEENKLVRKRTSSDNSSINGQICCYYYE